MKSYCLKCKKDNKKKKKKNQKIKIKKSENKNPKVSNTSNEKTVLLLKCTKCGSKKSRSIKNQEAKGLSSNLGIRTPLSKVRLLGDILFKKYVRTL